MSSTDRKYNLEGQRFGRLVAVEPMRYAHDMGRTTAGWLCKCDCGATKIVRTACLTRGNTRSCGCLQREAAAEQCKSRAERGDLPWHPHHDAAIWQAVHFGDSDERTAAQLCRSVEDVAKRREYLIETARQNGNLREDA